MYYISLFCKLSPIIHNSYELILTPLHNSNRQNVKEISLFRDGLARTNPAKYVCKYSNR